MNPGHTATPPTPSAVGLVNFIVLQLATNLASFSYRPLMDVDEEVQLMRRD